MTPSTRRTLILCIVAFSAPLVFAGCWKSAPPPLPLGQQTVSGLIKPASISVSRRGTHVLIQGGQEIAYLESATVKLGDFEGRTVDVTGTYEPNTDPRDIPVIVVVSVKGGGDLAKSWNIPSLGVSLDTPPSWRADINGTDVQFTATTSAPPILSLFLENESDLVSSDASQGDVTVTTVTVDGRRAVRSKNASTGVERIQIVRDVLAGDPAGNVLTLLFTPSGEEQLDPLAWDGLKDDIIRSLTFTGEAVSSSSASSEAASPVPLSGSGTAASVSTGDGSSASSSGPILGSPCGGEAGILCPAGFYCEITDIAANVGRCKAL